MEIIIVNEYQDIRRIVEFAWIQYEKSSSYYGRDAWNWEGILKQPIELMKNVSLRTATADDASFAFDCESEVMRPYAIATWGECPEERIRLRAYENACAGKTKIIAKPLCGTFFTFTLS